jgi:hypothetical protein
MRDKEYTEVWAHIPRYDPVTQSYVDVGLETDLIHVHGMVIRAEIELDSLREKWRPLDNPTFVSWPSRGEESIEEKILAELNSAPVMAKCPGGPEPAPNCPFARIEIIGWHFGRSDVRLQTAYRVRSLPVTNPADAARGVREYREVTLTATFIFEVFGNVCYRVFCED